LCGDSGFRLCTTTSPCGYGRARYLTCAPQGARLPGTTVENMTPHSRGALCVRVMPTTSSLQKQRAQGMPGARRTHCLACKQKRRTQANTGTPKSLRHSLRNGLTAAPCSSWCAGLVSHHRLRGVSDRRPTSRKLDSSIGEPEPHGLTVRGCAARLAAQTRPSQPASRLVTNGHHVPRVEAGWLR
jgi:hypothetical protein